MMGKSRFVGTKKKEMGEEQVNVPWLKQKETRKSENTKNTQNGMGIGWRN